MKLDKPTTIALVTFAVAMLGVLAAKLAGELTTQQAFQAASGPVMALLGALSVISHGTPPAIEAPKADAPKAVDAPKDAS